MKIVLYEDKYKDELESLLKQFSMEVFKEGTADVDTFVGGHWAIYLALVEDKVIGFSSFMFNSYFGMRPPTLGNTYIYVVKEHRTSKAMYLFSLQAGKICIDNGVDLEHYYSSYDSFKLSRKMEGTMMYETYVYGVDEVKKVFDRLNKKVRIKE